MKVELGSPWLAPDGRRYLAGEYDFPANFAEHLPSSGRVIAEAVVVKPAPKSKPAPKVAEE